MDKRLFVADQRPTPCRIQRPQSWRCCHWWRRPERQLRSIRAGRKRPLAIALGHWARWLQVRPGSVDRRQVLIL